MPPTTLPPPSPPALSVAPTLMEAASVGEQLSAGAAADGVLLFGSVARGDAHETSDVDLLILGGGSPGRFACRIPARASIHVRSREQLAHLFEQDWLFTAHLRHEGRILHDPRGVLERLLSSPFSVDRAVELGHAHERRRLEPYQRLGGVGLGEDFTRARLFSIGKSIAMLGLAAGGEMVFSRGRALDLYGRRRPAIADATQLVSRLAHAHDHVARGLPLGGRSEIEPEVAVEAVTAMADAL